MSERIALAYIASPSFSGSTLLTFLLNAHPDIATIGELKWKWGTVDLDRYQCSCGTLLRECHYWAQVAAQMRARGFPFDLVRPATDFRCRGHAFADRVARSRVRGRLLEIARCGLLKVMPSARQAWSTVTSMNRAVIEVILRSQAGRVFVDASKDPVRLLHLCRTGDYTIRVIHFIRDGRGVVYSARKNEGASIESAAWEWLRTHGQIARMTTRLGAGRVLVLRYEDLCAGVGSAMERVFQFLELPPHRVADFRSATHHILGNVMRLKSSSKIKLDETWRQVLSADDLRNFERIGGAANRRFGYV